MRLLEPLIDVATVPVSKDFKTHELSPGQLIGVNRPVAETKK